METQSNARILPEALPQGRKRPPGGVDGPRAPRIAAGVLRLLDAAYGRGDTLGDGAQAVASLQDERQGGRPGLVGEVRKGPGEAAERVGLERHASQRICRVGVVAGGDDDEPRAKLAQHGEKDPGERRHVSLFPRAGGEGHVYGEAPSFPLPNLPGVARAGIEGALVRREVEDVAVVVEDILSTVAVVHGPVEDGYPLDPEIGRASCRE